MIIKIDGYESAYKGKEVDAAVGRAQKAVIADADNLFIGSNEFQGEVILGSQAVADTPALDDDSDKVATTGFIKAQGYITAITSNDITNALGYTPYSDANPDGFQANVIEVIQVNGTTLTPTNKTINVTVPTDTSELTNGAGYITGISSSMIIDALTYTPESTANKVTIISSESTDTQYPSAKAVYTATNANASAISTINSKIPEAATSSNQLADKAFVNSSIATSTATFRGTFNSLEALEEYSGPKDDNDYAFVITTDSTGNTAYDRYKYDGTQWVYEYALNNSSFTADQWAAINSGATTSNIDQIATNTSLIGDLQTDKQDIITDLETIRAGATAGATALQPNDDISELVNNVGYITGIDSTDVTNALGYTPYNSTNPNNYQENLIETIQVNGTTQAITNKTVNVPVPTDTSELTNGAGYITGIDSTDVTNALGYTPYDSTNPDGYISGITSNDVVSALGYTPYDASNPNGYISSASIDTLTDVNVSNITNDQALLYNTTSGKWENKDIVLEVSWGEILGTLSDQVDLQAALDEKTTMAAVEAKGYITGINSSMVVNALGYTPYDASNPAGYIVGISGNDVVNALGYTPENEANKTITINASSTDIQYPSAKAVYDAIPVVMIGASESADGASGLVPQPVIGNEENVLKGDGTWGLQDTLYITDYTI